MRKKMKFLWVSLVAFIVYYDEPSVCNAIVAIGNRDKGLIIIRPEYNDRLIIMEMDVVLRERITANFQPQEFRVQTGSGFKIDTWDDRLISG